MTRRRFRFSSRAIFVVVTVLVCLLGWVGWQARIIRERQRVIEKWRPQYKVMFITLAKMHEDLATAHMVGTSDWYSAPHEHMPEICLIRRWMGDETIARIDVVGDLTTAEKSELLAPFPEAFIDWNATISEKTPAPVL